MKDSRKPQNIGESSQPCKLAPWLIADYEPEASILKGCHAR